MSISKKGCSFHRKFVIISFVIINLISESQASTRPTKFGDKSEFDLLIFAQIWPETDCIEWKERSSDNTCDLKHADGWTIHGIWPTKDGEIGPLYCNHTSKFNPDLVEPLMSELKVHWTNVHQNSDRYGFWKHEWEKHGTCAAVLQPLDNEYKFFKQGLDWNAAFPIYDYFTAAGILPGKQYSVKQLYAAVHSHLNGVHPAIECSYDHHEHRHLLQQVNVCFGKNFELVDCNPIVGGIYGRCPTEGESILYPAKPTNEEELIETVERFSTIQMIVYCFLGAVLFLLVVLLIVQALKLLRQRNMRIMYERV